MSRPRVVVGMSGGVDSSVAAALLAEQGYHVIGVAMRLWGEATGSGCCSLDDFLDARRVAAKLDIPFYVMDFRDDFERQVVAPFVSEYLAGRTPNPCARCNQFVKFAALWDRARELGAEWIATGHYARVRHPPEVRESELWAAADRDKDQSYYLFGIGADVLARTLFPVGELCKAEVRERARALGLPVADKPESQEICFAPRSGYAHLVAQRSSPSAIRPGVVVDEEGRVLGHHDGIHRFTVGQRRGLGLSSGKPLYVLDIEEQRGVVRVGPRAATLSHGLLAVRANWLSAPPRAGDRLALKIRSRFAPVPVTACRVSEGEFEVLAEQALAAVAPGQAAVLYDGDRVVGGGWIERRTTACE